MDSVYMCPKCNRYGFAWDARAKVLMCHWSGCSHVIRVPKELGRAPNRAEALLLIKCDHSEEVTKLKEENLELKAEIVKLKALLQFALNRICRLVS